MDAVGCFYLVLVSCGLVGGGRAERVERLKWRALEMCASGFMCLLAM